MVTHYGGGEGGYYGEMDGDRLVSEARLCSVYIVQVDTYRMLVNLLTLKRMVLPGPKTLSLLLLAIKWAPGSSLPNLKVQTNYQTWQEEKTDDPWRKEAGS